MVAGFSLSVAAARMTAAGESATMLSVSIVIGIADVALSVTRFVCLEVLEGPCAALGQWSVVAIMRIPAVIDVAIEAVWAMEPGTGSDENSAGKPIRPIVAVRGAAIRRIVKISVWAYRRRSNIDGNLGGR